MKESQIHSALKSPVRKKKIDFFLLDFLRQYAFCLIIIDC